MTPEQALASGWQTVTLLRGASELNFDYADREAAIRSAIRKIMWASHAIAR